MARGWESKSIESQQEDRAAKARHAGPPLTAEERERQARRAALELSRARTMRELEATTMPARRASLESALAYLDEQLRSLDNE
jgi:hypothetical protein